MARAGPHSRFVRDLVVTHLRTKKEPSNYLALAWIFNRFEVWKWTYIFWFRELIPALGLFPFLSIFPFPSLFAQKIYSRNICCQRLTDQTGPGKVLFAVTMGKCSYFIVTFISILRRRFPKNRAVLFPHGGALLLSLPLEVGAYNWTWRVQTPCNPSAKTSRTHMSNC